MSNPITFQSAGAGNVPGWNEFVREANSRGIPISVAVTDTEAMINDMQRWGHVYQVENRANFTPTGYVPPREMRRIAPEWKNKWGAYHLSVPDYRIHKDKNTAEDYYRRGAKLHVNAVLLRTPPALIHKIVTVSSWNEIRATNGWEDTGQMPFYTGWMDAIGRQAFYIGEELVRRKLAGKRYFRWAAFAFSGGNPPLDGWEQPGMLDYLRLCEKHPDVLGVALHEYSFDNNLFRDFENRNFIGRFEHLFKMCDKHGIKRPFVEIKEFGWHERKIPPLDTAQRQLTLASSYYQQFPEIKLAAIWTAANGWGKASEDVPKLAEHVYSITLGGQPPKPDLPPKEAVIVNLIKSEATPEQAQLVMAEARNNKQPIVWKLSQAEILIGDGSDESRIKEWSFEQPDPPTSPGNPLNSLRLGPLFANEYIITSKFSDRRSYANGKHEGIDAITRHRPRGNNMADVLCVFPGIVDRSIDKPDGYGKYVRVVSENNGSKLLFWYGHLDQRFAQVGQKLETGDRIGEVGATGNASGEHIHLTMAAPGYGLRGYVVDWVVDPLPFFGEQEAIKYDAFVTAKNGLRLRAGAGTAHHITAVMPFGSRIGIIDDNASWWKVRYGHVTGYAWKTYIKKEGEGQDTIDLLPYLQGNGRMYEVQHNTGQTETFQTESQGNGRFIQKKNAQYEQFHYDNDFIYRSIDTSPGPAPIGSERPGQSRYYTQYDPGDNKAKWCPRHMYIGQSWRGSGHHVQFYYKADCAKSSMNSGAATNQVQLVAKHTNWIGFNGIVIADVIQLRTNTGEDMYFGKGYGLVGWSMASRKSRISEIHHGRNTIAKEKGCWEE